MAGGLYVLKACESASGDCDDTNPLFFFVAFYLADWSASALAMAAAWASSLSAWSFFWAETTAAATAWPAVSATSYALPKWVSPVFGAPSPSFLLSLAPYPSEDGFGAGSSDGGSISLIAPAVIKRAATKYNFMLVFIVL